MKLSGELRLRRKRLATIVVAASSLTLGITTSAAVSHQMSDDDPTTTVAQSSSSPDDEAARDRFLERIGNDRRDRRELADESDSAPDLANTPEDLTFQIDDDDVVEDETESPEDSSEASADAESEPTDSSPEVTEVPAAAAPAEPGPAAAPDRTTSAAPAPTPTQARAPQPASAPPATPSQAPTRTQAPAPAAQPVPTTPPAAAPPAPAPSQGGTPSDLASRQSEMVAALNADRSANGLAQLGRNSEMDSVAQAWAEHMASTGNLVHNPNYSSQIPSGWTRAAENILYDWTLSPSQWQTNWMNSAGHRANILGDSFTHVGVGYAKHADGRYFAVQVFATY